MIGTKFLAKWYRWFAILKNQGTKLMNYVG